MEENPLMKMYEAQAIAIEQQILIDQLQREKEELEQRVRRLEEERQVERQAAASSIPPSPSESSLASDWTVIANEAITGEEQSEVDSTIKETKKTIVLLGKIGNGRQVYVLSEDGWKTAPIELPERISRGGAVVLNREIHIFGGNYMLDRMYKLNRNIKWTRLGNMKEKSSHIANSCVEWRGGILVLGGWNGQTSQSRVYRYNPSLWFFQKKWSIASEMKEARLNAAASVCGKVVVSGGWNVDKKTLNSVESLDPDSGEWSSLPDLPTTRSGHCQVSLGDEVLVLGGCTGETYLQSVLRLRPMEDNAEWEELPPMRWACDGAAAAILDGEIYSIGGYNGKEELSRVEIFDGTSWREGPELPTPCQGLSALVVSQSLADRLCLPFQTINNIY